jgi:D-alanyl-D-alanine carboxypeptidase
VRVLTYIATTLTVISVFVPAQTLALPSHPSLRVLVNQSHPLQPKTYIPADLVVPKVTLATGPYDTEMQLAHPAARSLEVMFTAAKKDNIDLELSSGYRSYIDQTLLYNELTSQSATFTELVAPPGSSEHQTGLAADIVLTSEFCAAEACFGMTTASTWLAVHSYKYGFILRYPYLGHEITKYDYEPWHFRYVAVPLATTLHTRGITLEEYNGIKAP